ncbi:hypothetical protein KW850_28955 [Bacillus sp. sid0103]|uniref:hypothetical protein n=1 Tax=Bacillus sp. sid0103 TaxID=2856337 RepID=UPI001C495517|nr:hypothetical protein [Bacillus sp. sid0103]MBV7509207.1 hypothetical protein [Bacillus sp. sid0103]
MLAKVNELNKNVVILLSVLIIAITSVVITLIATAEPGGDADPLTDLSDFQTSFTKEYGVKPSVQLIVQPDTTEAQAEILTKKISNSLELGNVKEDDTLSGWFNAKNDDEGISLTVISKYDKK